VLSRIARVEYEIPANMSPDLRDLLGCVAGGGGPSSAASSPGVGLCPVRYPCSVPAPVLLLLGTHPCLSVQ
jgi:hypothetical protein